MTTTTTSIKREGKVSTGLVIGALLAVVGIAAWAYQLSQGLQVTGLNQQIVWGLYIAAFFTAVGAGAALLALTGYSEFDERLPIPVKQRNLLLALACFITGGLLIAVDLGNPIRTMLIVSAFRFSSTMTWDFWLLGLAMLVALIYLLVSKNASSRKVMGVLGILASLAVVVVEAWMLSSLAAHPMWTSAFTVVTFLVGAAIAGISVAMAAGVTNEKTRGWLKTLLVVSLALVIFEILTSMVRGSEESGLFLGGFATPAVAWQVVLGIIVPLVLLSQKIYHLVTGALALSGVVAEKVWLLAIGQAKPWLDLPEGVYSPTWIEVLAVIGMAGIGYLIYRLLVLIFKPEPVK